MICDMALHEDGSIQTVQDIGREERLRTDFENLFHIRMEFSPEEARYISQPSETMWRNRMLSRYFRGRADITIIDAFACVGGDSVSLMHTFPACHLHSVQLGEKDDERQRYNRLYNNLSSAKHVFAKEADVHPYMLSISDAFDQIKRSASKIDLLYLDPPWFDGKTKLNIDGICSFLKENVFDPMQTAKITPLCICLKLDIKSTGLRNSENFQALIKNYRHVNEIGVFRSKRKTPVYFFHIFWARHQNLRANLSTVDARLDSILLRLSDHSNY